MTMQERPKADRTVRTFCRVCEPACGLVAEIAGDEIAALRPDRNNPVSQGFACHKGIATLDIHKDPDRLDHPVKRSEGGEFEHISWDEAADEIGEKLQALLDEHGPECLAIYVGNPTAFNTLGAQASLPFAGQLGVKRFFNSGTQDCANKFAGSQAVFGSSTVQLVPDLEHTDFLMIFGANPRVSHWSFISVADPMAALRRIRDRGGEVHIVNPRRVETLESGVGQWVDIRPDTDLYLMAAMLQHIDATSGFDEAAVSTHGRHVEELRQFVADYTPDRVADVVGLSADRIRALAEGFAGARAASIHMSTGVNMGRQGTLAYWLMHMLAFVTGNLDRRGGNVRSVGFYDNSKSGRGDYGSGFAESEFGEVRRGALPGNLMADYILEAENPVRAMVVVAGNPVLSIGGEARLRAAFEKLELLVCIDLYRNASGEYADYLLPATDSLERADVNITGLGYQQQPYVQFTEAVVPARGERREEWWAFAKLCQAMGLKSPLDAEGDPAEAMWGRIDHMMARRGTSLEQLRARPDGLALERFEPDEPLPTGEFYDRHLQTSDGRVDCCPEAFAEGMEHAARQFEALEEGPADTLKLITRRTDMMMNSWYENLPRMQRRKGARNPLYMHPEDLSARGLEDGAAVKVRSAWGEVEAVLAADEGLKPGVVAMTHGAGNRQSRGLRVASETPGTNVNALLPSGEGSFDPLSNQAFMTGIPVSID
jgi:anaerobic selenocysteine-containing dehydrogenase